MYDLNTILNELEDVDRLAQQGSVIRCGDNLGGFDQHYSNAIFDKLKQYNQKYSIIYHQVLPSTVKSRYNNFQFIYDPEFQDQVVLKYLLPFEDSEKQTFENFVCSFNGNGHVSRQLLVAALHVRDWANPATVSKNFTSTPQAIDGHVQQYTGSRDRFYLKQFVNATSNEYLAIVNDLNNRERYNHLPNCRRLSPLIKSSFVHIVSEAMGTSYVPFVTEKFLYSVVNRSIFIGYAQPRWHSWLTDVYGFKLYDKLFDYSFDTIENPVLRLVELLCMLSKFEHLSTFDKHDLYLMVEPQREFNYDHYKSGDYRECMEKFAG